MELAKPLYWCILHILIFVEVANLRMELARSTVLLFSYFCGARQSQMELARPLYSYFLIFVELGNLQMELSRSSVFLFSYFCGARQSSNGAI